MLTRKPAAERKSSDRPRIALDAAALHEPGHDRGLGRYTRALLDVASGLPEYEFVEYHGRHTDRHRLSEWLDIPHRSRFLIGQRACYHATSPYHLSPAHLGRTVVSVQDVIPLELDPYHQTGIKARTFFAWAARCPVIVTSSHYTAERIHALLDYPPEQIVVSPLPVAHVPDDQECRRCRAPDRLERYVVSLVDTATPDPRKRVAWLIGAAALLARHEIPLVLCGTGTERMHAPNVIGLGRLCDAHLRHTLARAECFLYATAYEGQGLPPQESLCEGTPVVAFRNTSLPEMLAGGALWLQEPEGPWRALGTESPRDPQAGALARGALSICTDEWLGRELAQAGQAHVATFTRERFASGVAAAYELLC